MVVGLRYFIAIICAVLVYWMFIKKQSHKNWYTCLTAVLFIGFLAFVLDFSFTILSYGNVQGAIVLILIFGLIDAVIFGLWRLSPKIMAKITKSGNKA